MKRLTIVNDKNEKDTVEKCCVTLIENHCQSKRITVSKKTRTRMRISTEYENENEYEYENEN